MSRRGRLRFRTVRSEGAILPPDLLERLTGAQGSIDGLTPEAYHLAESEKLNEAMSRAWQRLLPAWRSFREARAKLPAGDAGTSLTREKWLLPLFHELGYGRLPAAKAVEIGGKSYPVSHGWGHVPIHFVGCGVDLDRRTRGVAGAARESPHSLVQELLNRSDERLWGFVSNGFELRILRDSSALTRQAYLEFDLEALFEGEEFADFILLWLLAHPSRLEAPDARETWLERWSHEARTRGERALDRLRGGVEQAIVALGTGFLAHKGNAALRRRLEAGEVTGHAYYRALLRLVYRLIFLFVAEDRDLLLDPEAPAEARQRYERYSTARLRELAGRLRGSRHVDLWRALSLVMAKLGDEAGCPALGLKGLGSFLWSPDALAALGDAEIENRHLLDAVRALAWSAEGGSRRPVDYKNLGSQELGSVYESLLELHPEIHAGAGTFELKTASGHERKTSGSYYTPESLIQCLLDSALDPVLQEAAAKPDAERAILALKVCDPACGSGHFLVAAAHRIAKRLARARTGDDEPAPVDVRHALRDVIGHCLHGVDLHEMAVELCKVSLWMEALEPGKPLSFLDNRILCGNSLLGTTPALLDQGIPEATFEALEGDDKAFVTELRRAARKFDPKQAEIPLPNVVPLPHDALAAAMAAIDRVDDSTLAGVRAKESSFSTLRGSAPYLKARLIPDTWCAAFVCRKVKGGPEPVTPRVFHTLRCGTAGVVSRETMAEIERLRKQYAWFHWHLEFPEVFRVPRAGESAENALTGWSGGFDVVLGNPPWERIKLQEEEWFGQRGSKVADAPTAAARRKLIAALEAEDPKLYREFVEDRRAAEGESHFVRSSDRYPLCGRGDINTYAIFAETNRAILAPTGRVGCIVPSGVATDDTTKLFFQDLVDSKALVSLFSFENEEFVFPAVHHAMKFSLLTCAGRSRQQGAAQFVFFARQGQHVHDTERRFSLSAEDVALLSPNTRTCPVFRSHRDAELTKAIYRRVPVLLREGEPEENPWGVQFARLLDMANDSGLFRTRAELEAQGARLDGNVFHEGDETWLPLYEAKMVHHFDHRFGSYEGQSESQANQGKLPETTPGSHADPRYVVLPRYWVPAAQVEDRLREKWHREWLLGWRDITNTTNERTVIAGVVPRVACGDTWLVMLPAHKAVEHVALLHAMLASFVLDYAARQKVGGTHLKFHVFKQLPVLPPGAFSAACMWHKGQEAGAWLLPRVLELTYTAWDLAPFAHDLGHDGPPFRWDEERRFRLRAELDAAFFHLYGISREDAAYILDTFPIVQRHDEKAHGECRTKRVILETYDALAEAASTGNPYRTPMTPPPADPAAAHPVPAPAAVPGLPPRLKPAASRKWPQEGSERAVGGGADG